MGMQASVCSPARSGSVFAKKGPCKHKREGGAVIPPSGIVVETGMSLLISLPVAVIASAQFLHSHGIAARYPRPLTRSHDRMMGGRARCRGSRKKGSRQQAGGREASRKQAGSIEDSKEAMTVGREARGEQGRRADGWR